MSRDLEELLRQALRPPQPPADFAERTLARLPAESSERPAVVPLRPRARRARVWLPLALAASLAAAVLIPIEWHQRQELAGHKAREQLIEALRVGSQKLDLAYRMVNSPPPAGGEDSSGV